MMQTYIPRSASVVVKSDTTVLPQTSYLYVGGTGHVTLLTENGETVFRCTKCGEVLIKIEKGGLLGDELTTLDEIIVTDHYLAKHT